MVKISSEWFTDTEQGKSGGRIAGVVNEQCTLTWDISRAQTRQDFEC